MVIVKSFLSQQLPAVELRSVLILASDRLIFEGESIGWFFFFFWSDLFRVKVFRYLVLERFVLLFQNK